MNPLIITKEDQIADDLLEYINNEAHKLSNQSEFEIENYMDSEVTNPEMKSYLKTNYSNQATTQQNISLTLSFNENRLLAADASIGGWFSDLKEKIRKVLCKVVGAIVGGSGFDWKSIIKTVLIALIPALAGSIYAAVIMPLLIGQIGKLIKLGYNAVCPV